MLRRLLSVLALLFCSWAFYGTASAQSYGTPTAATCTQDGKLWYNDGQTLYTHTLGTNTNTLIGSGGIPNSGGGFLQPTITYSYGDIGWGADGNLYAVEFPSDWTNQTKSSGLWVVNSTNGSASRIATINLTEGPINGLSGLPDGRLLFGQLANTQRFVADTSKIWVIRPGTGTLTPSVWATLPSPLPDRSTYAHSSGDMVLIGNTVYAAFVSEKYNAYIYKYQVDSSYNPVGSPSVMAVTLNGTNVGNNGLFGLASYGGKLYATNNGNAPVYTVDLSSGALTDTGETFTSNQTYGLTAKPEPWGGQCAPILELKKNIDRGRANSSDQFTVQIQDASGATLQSATTSGTATTATTGTYVGTAGTTYKLTEIAASGTNLSLYSQAMSCTNATTGSTTALPTTVGGTVTLRMGDMVTCTITNSLRPQLPVTKSYSPATIPSDGVTTSTLTITLGNSTGAAHTLSAALNDNIGAGLVITGVSGGTCDATRTSYSGTTITYAAGATIPNGGCTIRATVRSTTPGSYPNTIPAGALTTTQGGINPAAANATLTVTTPTPPKLTITKSDNNQAFMAGQTGTYTVTVSNASGAAATSGAIAVSDLLPSGMSFNSVTTTTAGSFGTRPAASATNRVDWTFTPAAPLTAGQSIAFTVTVNVVNIAADGTTLTNFASVGGGGDPDPQPTPGATCAGEQCASDTTTILAPSGPAVPPGTWSSSTCLDFSGVALSVGGTPITRTVTTAEGVVITYTLDVTSNVRYATATDTASNTENVLKGYVPGSWGGDRWDDYFGGGKTNAVYNNPVGRIVGFTLSAYATYNSQPVPLTVLTGSAEDDGTNEYVQVVTNGTPFAVADRTVGNTRYGDVSVSGNGQTVKMSVNSATGNFLLVATSKADATSSNPLVLTSEIAGNGATAQGYCVAFPFDRGDAPTSYGNAAHLQSLTFASPLTSNTTGTNNLNSATFAPSATTSRTTSALNGQPDSENVEKGATATEDSDDVLTTPLKALRLSDKAYAVTLPYATNVAATISGWIDFNGNGTFDTAERVTASVPAGVGQATLNWSGITVTTASTGTFARFRIATNATEATAPTGAAIVGEVEDYPLPVDRSARLTFVLNAIPDHAQDFVYTVTGTGLSNFTLDDDADPALSNTRSFTGLTRGTYTVTQAAVAGWKLTGLTCTPSGSAAVDSASGKVTVALTDGADVTCTYTNTQLPNVSLIKYVRNTAVQDQKFSATSSQALPGQILQYCIAFNNTGATAGNFVLVDAFPRNTTAQGGLIYSAPATDLTQSSASPTATPLPAGATYSATNVPEKPGSQTLVPGVKLDLGAAGLVGGTSGTVCFNATVQ